MLARLVDPEFNPQAYGYDSLRALITEGEQQLKVIGLSGPDPIYGLASATSAPITEFTRSHDAWRTWVSPSSPFFLAVDRATGAVGVLPVKAEPAVGEVRIDPANFETHKAIAQAFLASEQLDSDIRKTLSEYLNRGNVWWRLWAPVLRVRRDTGARWTEFRRQRLQEHLVEALVAQGVPEPTAKQALENVVGTPKHPAVPKGPENRTLPGGLDAPAAQDAVRAAPEQLALLVQQVVSLMAEDQLRNLSLPVGLVLDVISRGKPKR